MLSIGQLAKKLGVHVQTLRRWEAAGKIKSIRTLGNHKRYNFEDFYVKNEKEI